MREKMDTFAALGIPFPLFEAPTKESDEYLGKQTCSLCASMGHCFRLGIGSTLIVECEACASPNGFDTSPRKSKLCRKCGSQVAFPKLKGKQMCVCYTCFREGKVALTKDTELGMISFDQSIEGVTNGPVTLPSDFEVVPTETEGWFAAVLPTEMMFELLRTPGYSTLQGEVWLFCCKQPMIYIGQWKPKEFTLHSPDGDGRAFFLSIVQDATPDMWGGEYEDHNSYYVFRCANCNTIKANYDCA